MCYLFMCLRVCVSSCMSILYCPGVLSGSRAAWSTEITVSSEGGGLVVEGGGEDCFSAAGALPEDCREIHYFSPLSTNIRRGLPRPALLQTRQRRGRAAITGTWTNLVLCGSMGGQWGKRCRYHGNCLNYHIDDMHVVMPIVTNAR